MKTGNGKIANLPSRIRDELNYRINDGEPGGELVDWLNSIPEVTDVLRERFDAAPISEQNLSEWRKRGYQQWLLYHVTLDESDALSDNAEEIAGTGINCDKLLLTLTASYAEMIQRWNITPADQMTYKIGVFKNLTNAVITLRRAEILSARLEIERARLELLREKQRNKSASSSSSPASSSAENIGPSNPEPNGPARPGDPAQSSAPASAPAPMPRKTAPPPSEPSVSQSPHATGPDTAPPTANPPPKPAITPYRDPRSRYNLL